MVPTHSEKDCKARGLNREDAMDHSRWRKQIGMIDDHDECLWVNVSSGTGSTRLSRTKSRAVKRLCVCVCVCVPAHSGSPGQRTTGVYYTCISMCSKDYMSVVIEHFPLC